MDKPRDYLASNLIGSYELPARICGLIKTVPSPAGLSPVPITWAATRLLQELTGITTGGSDDRCAPLCGVVPRAV